MAIWLDIAPSSESGACRPFRREVAGHYEENLVKLARHESGERCDDNGPKWFHALVQSE
jgi:hypothetical protein